MKLVLLLGLVAACYAQVPTPCELGYGEKNGFAESPKQWEGRRVVYDPSKKFTEISRIAYDELGRRLRRVEEIEQGEERDFYDILELFNENKEYRVNLRTKQCNQTTISHPFREVGVPRDAKFLFENEVGAAQIPNEHFTAVTFGGQYATDDVRYMTTVTYPDCVPVADNYYNNITGFIETRYFDIKGGIANPEAFLPPSECM